MVAPNKSTGGTAPRKRAGGGILISHMFPFSAHDGSCALMVSHGSPIHPLPHLYSFAIYVTDASLTRDNFDAAALYESASS